METNLRQLQHPSRASSSCKSHLEDTSSPGPGGSPPHTCALDHSWAEGFIQFLRIGVNFEMRKDFDIPKRSRISDIPVLGSGGDTALSGDESNLFGKKPVIRKQQRADSVQVVSFSLQIQHQENETSKKKEKKKDPFRNLKYKSFIVI